MLQQELPICLCLPLPPWQVKRIGVNLQLGQYLGARDKVEEGRKPVAEGEENRAGEPETPEECSNAREVGRGDNLCCPETGWSENLHYTSKDTHYINLVQKETVPAKFEGIDTLPSDMEQGRRPHVPYNKVEVSLDPDTAHPWLLLSANWKSVKWATKQQHLPQNPERFDTVSCVLGREGFTSGKHYWEVGVKKWGGALDGKPSVRQRPFLQVILDNPVIYLEPPWCSGQRTSCP
ncbi:hypothetical protein Y1Q_0001697 [Alligator mississippiensis]|uniref:B30.2/SPRY domain-containing protein n=1 Tax=Alligator mississippiensis TaxID=8496 RepID=A0A151MAR2_ALLMI|nr:hypothetical protein Y1Q_0001697 [Alligator mississippiensis]